MRFATGFVRCGVLGVLVLAIGGCTPAGPMPGDNSNDNNGNGAAHWQLVLKELPAGLLSVSGTSSSDVYAVGADTMDGAGPLLLHYDGTSWRRIATGAAGDLWWITDRKVGDSFFLAGEGGLIFRYKTTDGSLERHMTPGTDTLFGIWGLTPDNLFAVGGNVDEPETGGVVWRFDGTTWTVDDLSAASPEGVPVLFKVWGRSANEVYACGSGGVVFKFDGSHWSKLASLGNIDATLFTIHGNTDRVVAVGGAQIGVIVELSGNTFEDVTPGDLVQMNGTFVPPTGKPVAVGQNGMIAFRDTAGWQTVDTGLNLDFSLDYHGAWIDPQGGVWAVGGNIVGEPQTDGIVVHYGTEDIGTTLVGG